MRAKNAILSLNFIGYFSCYMDLKTTPRFQTSGLPFWARELGSLAAPPGRSGVGSRASINARLGQDNQAELEAMTAPRGWASISSPTKA